MEIILAKSAGFCFGVKLAVDCVYEKSKEDKIYTYGPIIHNKNVVKDLEKQGVEIIENLEKDINGKVIIRSHGVPPSVYKLLEQKNIEYVDCTCPFVKKIHRIVDENYKQGKSVIIIGNKNHPEIIGINGFCDNTALIANSIEEFNNLDIENNKEYILVSQTTFDITVFEKLLQGIKNNNIKVFNTICSATNDRQKEALELSKQVDYMIVLGDTSSSNTQKLYEICKKNCENTYLCETIKDLQLNNFKKNVKIGITAGASTPPAIIKEALNKMNEMENMSFEEMLNESFKTLHNGSVVKGSVIRVTDNEVFVNLGYKADGVIEKSEFSNDANINLKNEVSVGDEIEVFVIKVNDGDGNVVLSKKRLEMNKGFDELEEAFNNKSILKGKIVDVIKGGLIANINNVRVFVPSSQISNKFVQDLNSFKGKEFDFNIIEFNKSKRRIIAGRRDLVQSMEDEAKAKVYENIKVGDKLEGTVSRIVDFGAFVDLGGVDGLIHISELSWGRVKKVSDVLREGDKVTVYVLEVDKDKNKISLSLKDSEKNPWVLAKDKYKISDVVEGKVVRLVDFGAFVELEEGVDGLVHISQICQKHIAKPEEVLSIGQVVKAKVTEIDTDNKKISLSIKEVDSPKEEDIKE
ncbi:MAG: bifunctional 4-hydroxy-3-methylbut-2-enyl diphosphate reductase/30S ribosomal protein S1 [Lachnospirales bacterium]|nr:bifunctional 4-hydroxy-3-methylbut-2-enyl diphosphate reductase/30S ribosomal protein S1 [Clostridiales bacterium]